MQIKQSLWLMGAFVLATTLFIIFIFASRPSDETTPKQVSSQPRPSSLVDNATLSRLATVNSSIDRSNLATDLTPPTNKWFSGFALQADPKPGFNYPTSFRPRVDGFEFGLPKVRAEQTIIKGAHSPDVVVTIENASSYKITDYDELTVEITYYDGAKKDIASVRVASGLPYVYITAKQNASIRFSGIVTAKDNWSAIKSNDNYYGLNTGSSNNRLSVPSGKHISFFSAPNKQSLDTLAKHANATVTSGKVSYEQLGNNFKTTITYKTLDDRPVLFARLPHQQPENAQSTVTYQSILGDLTTSSGRSFSFTTPKLDVTEKLDLSSISDSERALLKEQLQKDIAAFQDKQDTYFGGKQLYRMAQLLMIARELNEDELATSAQNKLRQELESWFRPGEREPKSFLYDPSMRGIVGNEASFGSDKEFNDHHFHYGYFIYAAAVLAESDKDFLNKYKTTVNLLVADIANYNSGEKLPLRRSFDPYAGHSWASGTVPFNDGNNQESTSEAINAWVGTTLWARQTNNDALKLQSQWMLSQEYRTTQLYWLLQQKNTPSYLAAYDSPVASIVWGGKREYATFFSDEPNAKLAIQLLPLSPTIKRSGGQLPEETFRDTSIDKPYGDYILMARPSAKLEDAINLPDSAIDDGNSRSYLYAYILSK